MKMRIVAKLFVLLSLFLGQCIGAPPQRDSTKSMSGTSYTKQEDELIINELLASLPDDNIPIFGYTLWNKIAEKHHEKWQQGTPGFPQERSRDSLRNRFKNILIFNHEGNVKVPVPFLQKIAAQQNQTTRRGSVVTLYSEEERKLIFEELLKPSCKSLHASSTWEAIRAEHDKRRLVDKLPEFQNERTAEGLRHYTRRQKGRLPDELAKKFGIPQKESTAGDLHQYTLRQKDRIPDELAKKFGIPQKGASSSNPPNRQTDFEIDEMIEELLNNTDYEIDFSKIDP